ncbi:alpha/beta hydrolase [Tessaracoccus coleopterorum]|uniref:alpha/beta hydrolase n=1 Tax=Tessaracoccus coleopterorum TaxID=2714950 RepID=UPI001E520FA6|nr:prolyl oligopeptidase family serine peptidase [Tessaracoccus coleopterorum]
MDWDDGRSRPHLTFGDCIAGVSAATPPTFLWTTNEDTTVPPTQSLRFAAALAEAGVEFEYHHFDRGPHGLSMATPLSNADRGALPENAQAWLGLCLSWLRATWAAR